MGGAAGTAKAGVVVVCLSVLLLLLLLLHCWSRPLAVQDAGLARLSAVASLWALWARM